MVVWFFTALSTTTLLMQVLAQPYWPRAWQGTYEEVLPYIRSAFNDVLTTLRRQVPAPFTEEITEIVIELCEPDPSLRGDRKHPSKTFNQFSLERYISKFD